LPKRQSKDKNDKTSSQEAGKITVVSADGGLRRLREKDLILETSRALLRFRLLAKTQFRNKAGDPIRDSLLHPGDQLSVEASPDDAETALRVILLRAGTAAERAAGERPVDEAAARSPEANDLSKPRTVPAQGGTEPPTQAEAATASPAAGDPEPNAPAPVGKASDSDDQILADARTAAATFSEGLPSYLAQEVMGRYFSVGGPGRWQIIDVVTAELSYVAGREQYRDYRIDGQPVNTPENTAGWSTGEFGSTLEDVLSPATHAAFHRRGEEKIGARTAVVFDLSVDQANSHWVLVAPDQHRSSPAYTGAIWVDKETRRVLRIEQKAADMPRDFPFRNAESVLTYAYARIEQLPYLLPATAENIGCMSGSGTCTKNTIEFRSYRKFTAESKVNF
jgi:hypothetical protein